MTATPTQAPWQRAIIILTWTVLAAFVVTCLYWAQAVFVPLALAVFLTFLLGPIVLWLQRHGLGRITSVVLVTVVSALFLGIIGWMLTRQITGLIGELPAYTENVRAKVRTVRDMFPKSNGKGFRHMVETISKEIEGEADEKGTAAPDDAAARQDEAPRVVAKTEDGPSWMANVVATLNNVVELAGTVALAVVLTIFMLLTREDLRNRFIRVASGGDVTLTTKAVDEASQRISRYLLMQLIINGTYGLAWGLGLFVIGIEYAFLWGFLAAVLRYVPYIGAPLGAIVPVVLSVAMHPGWAKPLEVVGYLIVIELISNNVMEPWLYSQSIGVSEVALLVAAAFWAFLWGPIGLVLSGPLTVLLVVLGRYVPELSFFAVLLGDEPALDPDVRFYQRLLARDQDEASQIAQDLLKKMPAEQVYDKLFVPALTAAKRDRDREVIADADEREMRRSLREIMATLDASPPVPPDGEAAEPAEVRIRVLACPARDEAEEAALELLRRLLNPLHWDVRVADADLLTAELVTLAEECKPAVICIGSLPPGGLAHARYLCKWMRGRFPETKLLVGRWGPSGDDAAALEQLQDAGADQVAMSLPETRDQLQAWQSVLAAQARERAAEAACPTDQEVQAQPDAINPAGRAAKVPAG